MTTASRPQGPPSAQPFAPAHYPGIVNKVLLNTGSGSVSYGAWLADEIQCRYFDWLDHPVQAHHRRRSLTQYFSNARTCGKRTRQKGDAGFAASHSQI